MNDEPTAADHDPEAGGFGNEHGRMRLEWLAVLLVVVGTPLALVWSARSVARWVASSLPPSMDAAIAQPTWQALRTASSECGAAPNEYVRRVAQPLLDALESPFDFEFLVVDSDEVNAFALPGGYVVVNMGLLQAAESGEEVAAVIAHELHHVTLRHGTERILAETGTYTLLTFFFGGGDLQAPAFTLSELASLDYDRDQEAAADTGAHALLKKAGISPAALATFFDRLSGLTVPPAVLSTHPDPGKRANDARAAAEGFAPRVELPNPSGLRCH